MKIYALIRTSWLLGFCENGGDDSSDYLEGVFSSKELAYDHVRTEYPEAEFTESPYERFCMDVDRYQAYDWRVEEFTLDVPEKIET